MYEKEALDFAELWYNYQNAKPVSSCSTGLYATVLNSHAGSRDFLYRGAEVEVLSFEGDLALVKSGGFQSHILKSNLRLKEVGFVPQKVDIPETPLRKPHVHADMIKKWADGAIIQARNYDGTWSDLDPNWVEDCVYRVKPDTLQPRYLNVYEGNGNVWSGFWRDSLEELSDEHKGGLIGYLEDKQDGSEYTFHKKVL